MNAAERAPEAVIVGGGPNGLAAAITIARAGHPVVLLERLDTIGGGVGRADIGGGGDAID